MYLHKLLEHLQAALALTFCVLQNHNLQVTLSPELILAVIYLQNLIDSLADYFRYYKWHMVESEVHLHQFFFLGAACITRFTPSTISSTYVKSRLQFP